MSDLKSNGKHIRLITFAPFKSNLQEKLNDMNNKIHKKIFLPLFLPLDNVLYLMDQTETTMAG